MADITKAFITGTTNIPGAYITGNSYCEGTQARCSGGGKYILVSKTNSPTSLGCTVTTYTDGKRPKFSEVLGFTSSLGSNLNTHSDSKLPTTGEITNDYHLGISINTNNGVNYIPSLSNARVRPRIRLYFSTVSTGAYAGLAKNIQNIYKIFQADDYAMSTNRQDITSNYTASTGRLSITKKYVEIQFSHTVTKLPDYFIANGGTAGNSTDYNCYLNTIWADTFYSIGSYAFLSQTNLSKASFYNVIELEDSVFDGCSNFSSMDEYGSLKIFGSGIFAGTNAGNTLVNGFIGRTYLYYRGHNGPESQGYFLRKKCIPQSTFRNCKSSNFTTITISDDIELIGDTAFDGCSNVTAITIGSGCTAIGKLAFNGCKKVKNIYIKSSTTGSSANTDVEILTENTYVWNNYSTNSCWGTGTDRVGYSVTASERSVTFSNGNPINKTTPPTTSDSYYGKHVQNLFCPYSGAAWKGTADTRTSGWYTSYAQFCAFNTSGLVYSSGSGGSGSGSGSSGSGSSGGTGSGTR